MQHLHSDSHNLVPLAGLSRLVDTQKSP